MADNRQEEKKTSKEDHTDRDTAKEARSENNDSKEERSTTRETGEDRSDKKDAGEGRKERGSSKGKGNRDREAQSRAAHERKAGKASRKALAKRTARRALAVAINVAVIVCFWYLVRFCFLPARSYHQAERLIGENNYEQAADLFTSISENYDLAPGSFHGFLARLGGFSDAAESVKSTRYAEAEYLRSLGQAGESLSQAGGTSQSDGTSELGGTSQSDGTSELGGTSQSDGTSQTGVTSDGNGSEDPAGETGTGSAQSGYEETYGKAVQIFEDLGDYSDSADQVKNTQLAWASSLAEDGSYEEAISMLEGLDGYDGGDWGNAGTLLDKTRYTLAGRLVTIGKLDDAEKLYSSTETYQDSYEQLRDLRYNLARDALLVSDFDKAKNLLNEVGDYKDSRQILAILDSAVDRVYQTDFTDIRGASTPAITSYIWMHSVIVPGRLDEGITVKMQEDLMTGGVVTAGLFGSGSYDYNLEQVRDADTWYFNYYGSDTEDSGGPVVLQADFGTNYASMTTKKVYAATRDAEEAAETAAAAESSGAEETSGAAETKVAAAEDDTSDERSDQSEEGDSASSETSDEASEASGSGVSGASTSDSGTPGTESSSAESSDTDSSDAESSDTDSSDSHGSDSSENNSDGSDREELPKLEFENERYWTEVSDEALAEQIREGFRTRRKIQLAENGNQYYYSSTDDSRLPHYCCVTNCLKEGTYLAENLAGRHYYCTDHYSEYTQDAAYDAGSDPALSGSMGGSS